MKRTAAQTGAPESSLLHQDAQFCPSGRSDGVKPVRVTEKQFSRQIEDLAALSGWFPFHNWISVRSAPGWPDYVMLNPTRGQCIAVEIKGTGGRLTDAQQQWLDRFRACNIPAYAWWPEDIEQAVAVLRGAGGGATASEEA